MPAFPRTADGRPALPRTQGGSLGQHIAQGTFSHRIFQGLKIANVTAACRARSRAAAASQTGAPPYSHGRLPGKADAAGEREDEQAPGGGRRPGPCLPQAHQRNASCPSGAGARPSASRLARRDCVSNCTVRGRGIALPGQRAILLPCFSGRQHAAGFPSCPREDGTAPPHPVPSRTVLSGGPFFIPRGHEKGAACAAPLFLKQHLREGTDCPGYFSCSASPIQVCRASTILRAWSALEMVNLLCCRYSPPIFL